MALFFLINVDSTGALSLNKDIDIFQMVGLFLWWQIKEKYVEIDWGDMSKVFLFAISSRLFSLPLLIVTASLSRIVLFLLLKFVWYMVVSFNCNDIIFLSILSIKNAYSIRCNHTFFFCELLLGYLKNCSYFPLLKILQLKLSKI